MENETIDLFTQQRIVNHDRCCKSRIRLLMIDAFAWNGTFNYGCF
jgi:hypothetical protein